MVEIMLSFFELDYLALIKTNEKRQLLYRYKQKIPAFARIFLFENLYPYELFVVLAAAGFAFWAPPCFT